MIDWMTIFAGIAAIVALIAVLGTLAVTLDSWIAAIVALIAVLVSGIAGIFWLIRIFQKPIEDQLKELKEGQKVIQKDIKFLLQKVK